MGLARSVGSRLKSPAEGNLPRACGSAGLPGITAPPNELNWDSVVLETGGTGTEIASRRWDPQSGSVALGWDPSAEGGPDGPAVSRLRWDGAYWRWLALTPNGPGSPQARRMPGPSPACGEVTAWLQGGGERSTGGMPASGRAALCFMLGSRAPLCRREKWEWRQEPRKRLHPHAIPGAAGVGGSLPAVLGREERQSEPRGERGGGSGWG